MNPVNEVPKPHSVRNKQVMGVGAGRLGLLSNAVPQEETFEYWTDS